MSMRASGNANCGGMMPTTSVGMPSIVTVRETSERSPP
jgi:hypothetical protein